MTHDWRQAADDLNTRGYAVLREVLSPAQCDNLTQSYDNAELFRSRVVMARHNFGRGEYQYFAYPLPPLVTELRAMFYPHLAEIANAWQGDYPATLEEFLQRCHQAGQTRPTPLLLRYGVDDFNCLHQDLYGDLVFPLQVTCLLSEPGRDFSGGEFVLTEQRPRMQSRVEVVPLRKGDAVIFPVRYRQVQGTRRPYRVNMRHGVSRVGAGSEGAQRHTLGVIFHEAK